MEMAFNLKLIPMIKILNRGFISVKPKTLFYIEVEKELQEKLMHISEPEATIYLIEEDFWDNESVLKKNYKKILECEKRQLSPSKKLELTEIKVDCLNDFFTFSFGNLVVDNEQNGISITKDDLLD
jgi:hypothetical protein